MKLSKLIKKLQKIRDVEGDLDVTTPQTNHFEKVEYVEVQKEDEKSKKVVTIE